MKETFKNSFYLPFLAKILWLKNQKKKRQFRRFFGVDFGKPEVKMLAYSPYFLPRFPIISDTS
ncbi:hypothetical protein D8X87_02785 [Listeria innocua]|nr:hypothetical protein [Listeria innocua]MBM5681775.1 hypothetical protein [Listeria innocua]